MSGRGGRDERKVGLDGSIGWFFDEALFLRLDGGRFSREVLVVVHVFNIVGKEAGEYAHNSLLFFAGHVVPLIFP